LSVFVVETDRLRVELEGSNVDNPVDDSERLPADMEDPSQSDKGVGKCVRVRVRGADSQGTVF
jgi:hypothetical protein